jgi:hypothetical protein
MNKDTQADLYRDYQFWEPEDINWDEVIPEMVRAFMLEGLDDIEQIGADEEREMRRMDAQDQKHAILKNFN